MGRGWRCAFRWTLQCVLSAWLWSSGSVTCASPKFVSLTSGLSSADRKMKELVFGRTSGPDSDDIFKLDTKNDLGIDALSRSQA